MKKLTNRQIEVLDLLSCGFSNNEIAEKLNISIHTVKKHLEQIFEILEVTSRVQAAVMAVKYGYIHFDEL